MTVPVKFFRGQWHVLMNIGTRRPTSRKLTFYMYYDTVLVESREDMTPW